MTTSTKGSGGKVRQRPFYVIRRYLNVDGHTSMKRWLNAPTSLRPIQLPDV